MFIYTKKKSIVIMKSNCRDNFCFKGQGIDHVGTLGKFCCPTLERNSPPFYLIRHEPMELKYH